ASSPTHKFLEVNDCVKQAVAAVRKEELIVLENRSVRIEEIYRNDAPAVAIEAAAFKGAIKEILWNAIEYSPSPGTITVQTYRRNQGGRKNAMIVISDQGQGVDSARIGRSALLKRVISPRAFEALSEQERLDLAFKKGVAPRGVVHGGDGLAFVREEVERAGGTVEIYSTPGAGTTVFIILPAGGLARRASVSMPLAEYLKRYGGERLTIAGKEFVFSKVDKLKSPHTRARRVIEYVAPAAVHNKFVLVHGTPQNIEKCYFYQGPALAIHGRTHNGEIGAQKVPLGKIIRAVLQKAKSKHLLAVVCNYHNGGLKGVSIPCIYPKSAVKRYKKDYFRSVTVVPRTKGSKSPEKIDIDENMHVCFSAKGWAANKRARGLLQPVSSYNLAENSLDVCNRNDTAAFSAQRKVQSLGSTWLSKESASSASSSSSGQDDQGKDFPRQRLLEAWIAVLLLAYIGDDLKVFLRSRGHQNSAARHINFEAIIDNHLDEIMMIAGYIRRNIFIVNSARSVSKSTARRLMNLNNTNSQVQLDLSAAQSIIYGAIKDLQGLSRSSSPASSSIAKSKHLVVIPVHNTRKSDAVSALLTEAGINVDGVLEIPITEYRKDISKKIKNYIQGVQSPRVTAVLYGQAWRACLNAALYGIVAGAFGIEESDSRKKADILIPFDYVEKVPPGALDDPRLAHRDFIRSHILRGSQSKDMLSILPHRIFIYGTQYPDFAGKKLPEKDAEFTVRIFRTTDEMIVYLKQTEYGQRPSVSSSADSKRQLALSSLDIYPQYLVLKERLNTVLSESDFARVMAELEEFMAHQSPFAFRSAKALPHLIELIFSPYVDKRIGDALLEFQSTYGLVGDNLNTTKLSQGGNLMSFYFAHKLCGRGYEVQALSIKVKKDGKAAQPDAVVHDKAQGETLIAEFKSTGPSW
ncbi:MAG: hypothetical protein KKF80_03655, partial [Candidatus Omnitrophica bacterium]|nr:hypothetical protein [Candidatus Omnitrophota bacterium]